MPITVKSRLGDDIRRFQLRDCASYEELRSSLARIYNCDSNSLIVQYTDDEGDLVTIASDAEFQEGLALSSKLFRCEVKMGKQKNFELPAALTSSWVVVPPKRNDDEVGEPAVVGSPTARSSPSSSSDSDSMQSSIALASNSRLPTWGMKSVSLSQEKVDRVVPVVTMTDEDAIPQHVSGPAPAKRLWVVENFSSGEPQEEVKPQEVKSLADSMSDASEATYVDLIKRAKEIREMVDSVSSRQHEESMKSCSPPYSDSVLEEDCMMRRKLQMIEQERASNDVENSVLLSKVEGADDRAADADRRREVEDLLGDCASVAEDIYEKLRSM